MAVEKRLRRVEMLVEASLPDTTWEMMCSDFEDLLLLLMSKYVMTEFRYRFEHVVRNQEGKVYVQ